MPIIALKLSELSATMKNKIFTIEDQNMLEELMLHRRDVRGNNFLSDDVSDEAIAQILRAASLAPSVGLSQPWEFVIIRDADIRQSVHNSFEQENLQAKTMYHGERKAAYSQLKLEGILEAPVNIAVFFTPSTSPILGQNSMPEVGEYSVVCAIQNMWLMARAMNIGIGWVSIVDPDTIKTLLNAPNTHKLVAYLCVGHVKEFYSVPELQRLGWGQRKIIESVVINNSYPNNE